MGMPCQFSTWISILAFAIRAIAQSINGVNGTALYNPSTNRSEEIGLAIMRSDDMPSPSIITIYPLTESSLKELPDNGISGTLAAITNDVGKNVNSSNVVWISCDGSDYPGNLGALDFVETAIVAEVAATVLYSRVDDYCNFTAGSALPASYNRLYSTSSPRDGAMLESMVNYPLGSAELDARINLQYKLQRDNGSDSSQGGSQQSSPGGPSPSTAVAMIILYSITGVITALFLVIIITGAIRAHRHPERYGPRAMLGRARQSRARGLARAMLDSIPIVKFGDDETAAPKPGDVELTAGPANESSREEPEITQAPKQSATTETKEKTDTTAGASKSRVSHDSEDGIRADTAVAASMTAQPDQAQGCSICTEDFERGEDVRLLPCSHKFHPPCIDPWLLNVSSTCPLCRVDLRPPTSSDQDRASDSGSTANGQPDIVSRLGVAASEDDGTNSRRTSHRLSFLFDPLNRRRMQDATPAERIEALRQYNQSQRNTDDSRRKRMSNRLSALINRSRGLGEGSEDPSRSVTPAIGHEEPNNELSIEQQRAITPEPQTQQAAHDAGISSDPVTDTSVSQPVVEGKYEHDATTASQAGGPTKPPPTEPEIEVSTPAASLYEEAPEHGTDADKTAN